MWQCCEGLSGEKSRGGRSVRKEGEKRQENGGEVERGGGVMVRSGRSGLS